jgi:hypothetical protein
MASYGAGQSFERAIDFATRTPAVLIRRDDILRLLVADQPATACRDGVAESVPRQGTRQTAATPSSARVSRPFLDLPRIEAS